jgi:RHS repeat-associated protein
MWSWFSDPFGTNLPNENPASLGAFSYNLRFPGQMFDAAAGLHQNYFRDYDPAVGKYIASDLIGLRGGINTYDYVFGNPISRYDQFGLLSVSPAVIEQALARAGLVEAIGGGPEDPVADIAAVVAAIGTIIVATDGTDPESAKNLMPMNPGRDCKGKCKPCPPNQTWSHPGDAHGSTGGVHYHGIVWNQNPATCMCFPNRVSGPDPKKLR